MDYLATPFNMRDYEIITKRLREKVHLEKTQGRKPTKGRIGSGTCLQNRGLHNYPMKYNREDVRSAKWSRENRRAGETVVKVDRGKSSALRQYSKDMFNGVVTNVPDTSERTVTQTRGSRVKKRSVASSVSSENSTVRESTGPTHDGSLLYNNHRPRVLNSIRIRPNTHIGCLYNHERSKVQKELRQAIDQKSDSYQLLDLNPKQRIGSSSSCASSSFLFIPKSIETEYSDVFESDTNHRSSTVADFLSELDGQDNSRYSDERLYSVLPEGNVESETGPPSISGSCKLLPPSTPCGLNFVSLNEESSSESEEGKEEHEPEKTEPVPPPSPVKKGKGAAPPPDVIPEPPPRPKLILKGPHCWVDDASVTSSEPEEDETENITDTPEEPSKDNPKQPEPVKPVTGKINTKQAPPGKVETNKANAKQIIPQQSATVPVVESALNNKISKENAGAVKGNVFITNTNGNTTDNIVNTGNQPEIAKPNTDAEQCVNGVDTDVAPSDGVTYVLPQFICPSSEKKSRESAIKEWLQSSHNMFRYQRSVPMV